MFHSGDIIVAPATASGGAIALVRMSGEGSIALCDQLFRGRRTLAESATHTLHYGEWVWADEVIDEVVVSLFRAPRSYTGEESVEISCHGSRYIIQRILESTQMLGARLAEPGEFSMRAMLNGRLDLSQAEAVADLIAAESQAANRLAMNQMRGHYSEVLSRLREQLLKLSSLLELELDFSEEDVEFADRTELHRHLEMIAGEVHRLEESFRLGNVLREGVMVAIVGAPNAGKSTLMNRLVGDERVLVSEIAGTTRDTIEERVQIGGVLYRFVDTAGLHLTSDRLDQMGQERTREAIRKAHIVLHLIDASSDEEGLLELPAGVDVIHLYNKIDRLSSQERAAYVKLSSPSLLLSAKTGEGVESLRQLLRRRVDTSALDCGATIVSSVRHAEALHLAAESLNRALEAFNQNLSSDLLAEELRQVAHHLGTITGAITSDEILRSIFSDFCIGK